MLQMHAILCEKMTIDASLVIAKKPIFFHEKRKKKYEGCEFHFSLSYFENMVLAFFVEKQKVGCISASFVVKDGQDIFGYILRIV